MAGFGAEALEIELGIDATRATVEVQKLGKELDHVEEGTKGSTSGFLGMAKGAKSTMEKLGRMGVLINGIKSLASTVAQVLQGVSEFVGDIHGQFDTLATARLFGASLEDANKLQGILTDVKTQMEAMAMVSEFRQLGLSQEDTQRFAHLVNVLAAVTGESKATLEARLKTGQVTDRELGALTKLTGHLKTQQGLQNQILKARLQGGGRALDQGERIRELLKFTEASAQMEASLGTLGAANPFDDLVQDAKTLWEEFTRALTPAIRATAKAMAKLGRMGISVLRKLGSGFKTLAQGLGRIAARLWVRVTQGSQALKWVDQLDARLKVQHAQQIKRAKELRKVQKAQQNQQKAALQAQAEALQEQMGRMSAARAMLRNFTRTSLAAISRMGVRGVGAVVGGMSGAIELARQFSALMGPDFEKRSKRAAQIFRLSMEAGAGGLVKLIEGERGQTAAMRAQLTLSTSMREQLNVRRQLADQERSVGQALLAIGRAQSVISGLRLKQQGLFVARLEKAKVALEEQDKIQRRLLKLRERIARISESTKLQMEALGFRRSEAKAADDLRKQLETLSQLQGFIVRDQGQGARAALEQLRIEIQAGKVRTESLKQRRELALNDRDRQLLDIQIDRETRTLAIMGEKMTLLRAESKVRRQVATRAQEAYNLEQSTKALQRQATEAEAAAQLSNLRARLSGQDEEVQSMSQVRSLMAQIAEQEATVLSLRKQASLLATNSQERVAMQAEISHRTRVLELRREELDLMHRQVRQEQARRTVFGSFMAQMAEQATGLQKKLGQQLANSTIGLAQSMSSAIGGLMTDLVTQPMSALDNFGKTILNTLGTLALQIGAFFAAQAAGWLFVPGGQVTAAGLFAAAAGLSVLGGLLKGGAALIGSSPSGASAAPSGSAGGLVPQSTVPGQEQPREERPVIILNNINSVPWRRQQDTSASEYRNMTRWAERQARATGVALGGSR